jgi:hypothetical protein
LWQVVGEWPEEVRGRWLWVGVSMRKGADQKEFLGLSRTGGFVSKRCKRDRNGGEG